MPFRDYFSSHAKEYARHRPGYPVSMFEYLASLAPGRELAWDCGTGNGQAALVLTNYFQNVIATDASAAQVENAFPHKKITYRVEKAENTTIRSHSVDLITVGTAVHWFDFDAFYAEVRRVAKRGILAVWTYHFPIIEPDIDHWLDTLYRGMLAGYWPEEIHFLEQHYRTLPFPFEEIQPPSFDMKADWDLSDFVGFVTSFSAARKLIEDNGETLLAEQLEKLGAIWGEKSKRREILWRLHIRIGKVA
jgi:SAM-dependent methyltransferase